MPESTVVRTKRDGQIAYLDAGGVNSYTVAYETGDFSLDVPDTAISLYLDRGVIGTTPSIRKGDEGPMTFSHTAYLRDVADPAAAHATLLDVCHQYAGAYVIANWTSTIGNSSDVVTWTTTLTIDGSAFGESDRTLTLNYSVPRASLSEGDPDTVNVSGTSYQKLPVLT